MQGEVEITIESIINHSWIENHGISWSKIGKINKRGAKKHSIGKQNLKNVGDRHINETKWTNIK